MGNVDVVITMMMVVINCFAEYLTNKNMKWFFPAGTITIGSYHLKTRYATCKV